MENIMELENIFFSYEDKIVVDNVSLNVKKGESIGIIGESGSGKSTLLKIMSGLYAPTKGRITVDGESDPDRIIKNVAVVMQTPQLLPMSIYDNITLGHDYSKEWVETVLKMASLDSWIDTLENGINTYLGDRANELSGGQAQRIAIARAMCKKSKILLLDEPTSALDRETGVSVLKALEEYAKDMTVIHVTHQTKDLEGYDRVFRIRNGKLFSL